MKISDLQHKDIVNVDDGRKLGKIIDLELDVTTGQIKTLIVPGDSKLFGLFANGKDWMISWEQIVKIGSDVILVKVDQSIEQADIMEMYSKPRGTLQKIDV